MRALSASPTALHFGRPARRAAAPAPAPAPALRPWAARASGARRPVVAAMTTTSSGITLDTAPSEAQLKELGVKSWPTWGCEKSVFPWSYDSAETAYVLKGRVIVTPDGGEPVEVKAGDLVTFPAGMSCQWDVKEAIHKHYKFH